MSFFTDMGEGAVIAIGDAPLFALETLNRQVHPLLGALIFGWDKGAGTCRHGIMSSEINHWGVNVAGGRSNLQISGDGALVDIDAVPNKRHGTVSFVGEKLKTLHVVAGKSNGEDAIVTCPPVAQGEIHLSAGDSWFAYFPIFNGSNSLDDLGDGLLLSAQADGGGLISFSASA